MKVNARNLQTHTHTYRGGEERERERTNYSPKSAYSLSLQSMMNGESFKLSSLTSETRQGLQLFPFLFSTVLKILFTAICFLKEIIGV